MTFRGRAWRSSVFAGLIILGAGFLMTGPSGAQPICIEPPDPLYPAPHIAEEAGDSVEERSFRRRYFNTPIAIAGTLLDENGAPISGAIVSFDDFNTVTPVATTDVTGTFFIRDLERRNRLLRIEAPGFRAIGEPVQLVRPIDEGVAQLRPIFMTADDPETTRFLFTGDIALGRRFLDPTGETSRDQMPPDNPDAMIRVSDPLPGTFRIFGYVRPMLLGDYVVANFESPVLDNPATPHLEKPFAFFTLPGSLPAFHWLGVDLPSLGNNHIFDYLDQGLADTFFHMQEIGYPTVGAGFDTDEAFTPFRVDLGGHRYRFLPMSSISGFQYELGFQADAIRGGAADLADDRKVIENIRMENERGNVPISLLHTGIEYTIEAEGFALNRMLFNVDAGAALVLAHHPHMAQGFSLYDDVLVAQSLGNFAFDQDRHETMLGMVAEVDMRGREIRRGRGFPVYLEDFRPRPIVGGLADYLLRRIAGVSVGAPVFPYNNRAWIALDDGEETFREERYEASFTIPEDGWTVVDLRGRSTSPGASLAFAKSDGADLLARPGRDSMIYGSFEDDDIDEETLDVARWDVTADSRFPCLYHPYRGTVAVCSTRSSTNGSDSVLPFRNRVRVEGHSLNRPNKDLSLFGYIRGKNAGPVTMVARYFASAGEAEFGEEVALRHPGGTFEWEPFQADLTMPEDNEFDIFLEHEFGSPRAVRPFFRHSPPARGEGLVSYDEVAIVTWEESFSLSAGFELKTPHVRDFLRVEGPPGDYTAELVYRVHQPKFPGCEEGPRTLCLNDGRFRVQAFWKNFEGEEGTAQAVPLTGDTGYFWFFNEENVELVIKILDGTGINGHFWTFYGALSNAEYTLLVTDTETGTTRAYTNPAGNFASVGDVQSFAGSGSPVLIPEDPSEVSEDFFAFPATSGEVVEETSGGRPTKADCVPGAETLCLNGGRFQVELGWSNFAGESGRGQAVSLTGDTGYFWFFDEENVEVILKVLDGRELNGHFWIFYGALSNVEYTITVTDTETGQAKRYRNPSGNFASVGDVEALP